MQLAGASIKPQIIETLTSSMTTIARAGLSIDAATTQAVVVDLERLYEPLFELEPGRNGGATVAGLRQTIAGLRALETNHSRNLGEIFDGFADALTGATLLPEG